MAETGKTEDPLRALRIELETKLGFLEHTVETLNDVIVDQGKGLDALERRLALFESRMKSQDDGGGADVRDLADDKPPHY